MNIRSLVSTRGGLALAASAIALFGAAPAGAAEPSRVLIYGDSISQGMGGDVTWRERLWESLQASPAAGTVDFVGARNGLFNYLAGTQDGGRDYAFPAFDQDHDALWGRRLSTGASQIGSAIGALPAKPTALVVELGTNDYGSGVDTAVAQARKLVAAARAAAPGIDLVLVAPYAPWVPRSRSWVAPAYFAQFAAALGTIATDLDSPAERVVVASLAGVDARTATWDGRHPNAAGELQIASAVAAALAAIGIGDGPHLPQTAAWPATAPAPGVALSGGRAIVTWPDTTIGALAYGIEQRRTAAGGVAGEWVRVTQPARTVRSWTSAALVAGDTYAFRVVPVRGLMSGTPGPATTVSLAAPPVTPTPTPAPARAARPWWSWFAWW